MWNAGQKSNEGYLIHTSDQLVVSIFSVDLLISMFWALRFLFALALSVY